MEKLIGREKEIAQLEEYVSSDFPEFIALYGRRRVGKTFLIDQLLGDRLDFSMTGVIGGSQEEEIFIFNEALRLKGYKAVGEEPDNWYKAFEALRILLTPKAESGKPTIIFIDELPCFDTQSSDFVRALDHFWNGWASKQPRVKLIVCGSATSWMVTNLIDSHGGLHNRITHEMYLRQFTLNEVEQYLKMKGFKWERDMIIKTYMTFGGIPYYLSLLRNTESLAQNIDRLIFDSNSTLNREYERLYSSLFRNADGYMKVIKVLSESKQGLTRQEIGAKIKSQGGSLTKWLTDLVRCDLIKCYNIRRKRNISSNGIYQLTDFFTLFHFTFLKKSSTAPDYWEKHLNTPIVNNWQGLAFERVCMAHIPQIKKALGIDRIYTEYYSWRSNGENGKAQIDLMIERADQMMNLCEIKYSEDEYLLDKAEMQKILRRRTLFKSETSTRSGIFLTLVTPVGLIKNSYSEEINQVVTGDDLFEVCD